METEQQLNSSVLSDGATNSSLHQDTETTPIMVQVTNHDTIDSTTTTTTAAAAGATTTATTAAATAATSTPVIQVKIALTTFPTVNSDNITSTVTVLQSLQQSMNDQQDCMVLPVDMHTTAREVVDKLMSCVNIDQFDHFDVDHLCLVEEINNKLGSYRRIIPDREKVLLIKQKWKRNRQGEFILTRRDLVPNVKGNTQSCSEFSSSTAATSRMSQRRYSLPVAERGRQAAMLVTNKHSPELNRSSEKISDLSKLMNQVVLDSNCNINSKRRGSWCSGGGGTFLSPLDIIKIEPIVCSPSYSVVKAYPEFVFSPVAENQQQEEEEEEEEEENNKTTITQKINTLKTEDGTSESDCDEGTNNRIEVSKIEKDNKGYVLVHTAVLKDHHYPVHPKKIFVKQQQHHQESSNIIIEKSLITHQQEETPQHTTANDTSILPIDNNDDMNPNTAAQASVDEDESEMNLLDSLSYIFDKKLNTQGIHTACSPPLTSSGLSGDLISPKRRASLVSEASKNIQRRRSITHSTEQPRITDRPPSHTTGDSNSSNTPVKSTSLSVLASPSRQKALTDAAIDFVQENRHQKSLGEPTNQLGSLRQMTIIPSTNDTNLECHNNDDDTITTYIPKQWQPITTTGSSNECSEEEEQEEKKIVTPEPQLRRHKSERSKSRLFSFLSRKTPAATTTTTAATESKQCEDKEEKSLPHNDFKRSRSVNFKRKKNILK